MQEILEAIVQGVVQGATEFLPVSSSGHLSLAQHFMGVQNTSLLFNVMLHIGTLAAVVLVYRRLILRLLLALVSLVRDVFTGRFKWSAMDPDRNLLVMLILGLVPLFFQALFIGVDLRLFPVDLPLFFLDRFGQLLIPLAGGLEGVDNLFKPPVVPFDQLAGILDDVLVQPKPAGDGEGVGLAGDADQQPVGGG